MRPRRLVLFLFLAIPFALAACTDPLPVEVVLPEATVVGPATSESEVLTVAGPSAPLLRTTGHPRRTPDGLLLELDRALVPASRVGEQATEISLRLDPPVAGTLTWTSRRTATFTPEVGLMPDTAYRATVRSIGDRKPDHPGDWTLRFETPPFALLGLELAKNALAQGRLELDLGFSGVAEPARVARALKLSVDGQPHSPTAVRRSDAPHRVRVVLEGLEVTDDVAIQASLDPVPSAVDPFAWTPATGRTLTVSAGPPVQVFAARLVEGAGGFAVEVTCDDEGSMTEGWRRRWVWIPGLGSSKRLSPRCELAAESVAGSLVLDPPVPVNVVPTRGGFRLLGDLPRGPLHLELAAGARTVDGGILRERFSEDLVVPARSAQLGFVSQGRYLPRTAWRNLAITHLNLDEVELTVRHVPPENLVFWLSGESEAADARTSDVILKTEVPVANVPDRTARTWLDVAELLPTVDNGLYELTLTGGGASASARLLLTDLTVVAKAGQPEAGQDWSDSLTAWVVDTHSLAPVASAEVALVRPSGAVLGTCRTDATGGCTLDADLEGPDQTAPAALLVKARGDLTVVELDALQTPLSEQAVQGLAYGVEAPYRVAAWTERGVYRPGDTVHFAALVRGPDRAAPPAGMPVVLTVRDARDREVRKVSLPTNPAGLLTWDLDLVDFAPTGSWSARFEVGGRDVATLPFAVEEFVPERMEVTAATAEPDVLAGEPLTVGIDARYLFGGSAAGSRVELSCRLEPGRFAPADAADLTFGTPVQGRVDLGRVTGELDDNGHVDLTCPTARQHATSGGTATLVADVAVFEGGSGRTTRGSARATVHPRSYYVGLKASADTLRGGQAVDIAGRIVDWSGQTLDTLDGVVLELSRLVTEYGYQVDPRTGHERWTRLQRPLPEDRQTVTVEDGEFRLALTPREDAGGFRLVATADGVRTELALGGTGERYWWYGDSDEVDQTPRPLRPTAVPVTVPEEIRVGERFTATFTAPYAGRALVSLETDGVVSSKWYDVRPGPVEQAFRLPEFAETAYVSVLVLKDPHLDSAQAFLPDRAFGVGRTRVVPEAWTGTLELDVPEEVRANAPMTVTVDLGPGDGPRWATVAAVDEGILSLTGYDSPDPFDAVFPQRALGVDTWETVGWTLMVPPSDSARRTGGDAESPMGRIQMVKPVSLWSGLVEVPESGRVDVVLDVPQYQGALRVMAVSAGSKRMAHADTRVLVRDPLVVQTTLPRFLNQGDVVDIPVFLTNLSGEARPVEVRLDLEPVAGHSETTPVSLVGEDATRIFLEDGEGTSVVFRVRADAAWGGARFIVTATSGDLRSVESLEAPVTTAAPRETLLTQHRLEDGLLDLDALVGDWVPTTERSTFWVTANPYGKAFGHLEYLVRYPHGCIEQTTSTTRPLLFVSNLLESTEPDLLADKDIDDMVMHGVNRVLAMQTTSGGFAYWPGGIEANYWGTAYATHMLLDAREAGYAVPKGPLEEALEFMERELAANEGRDDTAHGHAFAYGEAYIHYALALGGKGQRARIQVALDELSPVPSGPEAERAYLLKAALYLSGDRRYESDLRDPGSAPLPADLGRHNDPAFYSELRRAGFTLSVYQDLFGTQGGDQLARRVGQGLEARVSSRYSTQELVWGITGLGKRVEGLSAEALNGVLWVDGRPVDPEYDEGALRTWSVTRASERDQLQLEVDVTDEAPLFLVVRSEGNKLVEEATPISQGLRVSRELLDDEGAPLDLSEHQLGDLVYVRVSLENTSVERVPNIALVDRIPAGWEIENPRLGRDTDADWIDTDEAWSADHVNLRDDRLEVFGALGGHEERQVVYQARAVSAGTFALPPVEAEAMYDPEVRARQPGGQVTVQAPWGDEVL